MGASRARLGAALTRPGFDRVLVPFLLVSFAVARAGRFEERDPYWETRAGVENLAGWPLIRPDTWSWSGVSGPWYQNSPLWNTLLGGGWQLAGFWGIFAVTLALLLAYFGVTYLLALHLGGRRLPALAGILVAVSPVISMLSPRGTLVVEVIVLATLLATWAAARYFATHQLTWWRLALVLLAAAGASVLGNWLHLSFLLFSPALAVLCAVVWWFAPIGRGARAWLAAASGVGWLAGPLLSPYGVALGLERTRAVQEACAGLILEWTTPLSTSVAPAFWLMALVSTVVAASLAVWLGRRLWLGGRSLEDGVLLAVCLIGVPSAVAGLASIRFLGIALLTLAPALAVAATRWLDALRAWLRNRPASRWREYTTGRFWRTVLTGVGVLLLPGTLYLGALHAEPVETTIVAQLPRGCRLFTSGNLAATALLTRPDLTVWIDGRADFYGREHILLTYAYWGLSAPDLVPPDATCVLIDMKADDAVKLGPAVAASGDWRLAGRDGALAYWVRAG